MAAGQELIAAVLAGTELRAAGFIVTVYGDVVVPRGGSLWTGTLIEVCARVGISETLVRTAVSRLVAAGRLSGARVGRRSYYRLDTSARDEFDQAAALLYAPEVPASGWQILHAPGLAPEEARLQRMGHMGGAVYLRPDRGQPPPAGALCFPAGDPGDLHALARFWDLTALDARYGDFLDRFGPVAEVPPPSDAAALVLRLLLVHVYRGVMLRDPRLPVAALPADWKGHAARALFRRLYRDLSPAADRWIGAHFEGMEGPLAERSPETGRRLAGLS